MRISYSSVLVLQALAKEYRYGFQIMEFTGLASGTTYPILRRFERDGLVRSRWERETDALRDGRPARRYYELTAKGSLALEEALERFTAQQRVFSPESPS